MSWDDRRTQPPTLLHGLWSQGHCSTPGELCRSQLGPGNAAHTMEITWADHANQLRAESPVCVPLHLPGAGPAPTALQHGADWTVTGSCKDRGGCSAALRHQRAVTTGHPDPSMLR